MTRWLCIIVIMWFKGHQFYSHAILSLLCLQTQSEPVSQAGTDCWAGLSVLHTQLQQNSRKYVFPPLRSRVLKMKMSAEREKTRETQVVTRPIKSICLFYWCCKSIKNNKIVCFWKEIENPPFNIKMKTVFYQNAF